MFHCVNCRKTQQNAKHNFRICKKSNWDLFFHEVFGHEWNLINAVIDIWRKVWRYREMHNVRDEDGNALNSEDRQLLTTFHSIWMKRLRNDENKDKEFSYLV